MQLTRMIIDYFYAQQLGVVSLSADESSRDDARDDFPLSTLHAYKVTPNGIIRMIRLYMSQTQLLIEQVWGGMVWGLGFGIWAGMIRKAAVQQRRDRRG